jgi:nucleotide-binding universal stress UspA family protein
VHVIHAWEGLPEYVLSDDSSELRDLNKEELTKEFMKSRECRLEELMNDAKSWVGKDIFNAVAPKAQVLKGRARKLIVEQIEALDADLLVMGTVARTGIPGFFIGNTAESIIDRIDCSVLAIKPDGFVSPVNKKKR